VPADTGQAKGSGDVQASPGRSTGDQLRNCKVLGDSGERPETKPDDRSGFRFTDKYRVAVVRSATKNLEIQSKNKELTNVRCDCVGTESTR